MAAGAAAKARIPARVASVPKCLYESAPDSLKKFGALMYFHNLKSIETTLRAAPEGSESVHAEIVRFALVLPESKPFYSFGGGNILDSP